MTDATKYYSIKGVSPERLADFLVNREEFQTVCLYNSSNVFSYKGLVAVNINTSEERNFNPLVIDGPNSSHFREVIPLLKKIVSEHIPRFKLDEVAA
ncbi:MAG: hypothetical protein AABW63_03265 [Nanoarchaeota archaeon]